jgi:hypothetical protein
MCAKSQHEPPYFQYVMDIWLKKLIFTPKQSHDSAFPYDLMQKKSIFFLYILKLKPNP